MAMNFVTVKGEDYHVSNYRLSINNIKLTDISEIKGLKSLANLQRLGLAHNQINEINALKKLTDLQIIDFSDNRIKKLRDWNISPTFKY